MSGAPARCFGIAREAVYSPGKVDADRAILEETAKSLVAQDVDVTLLDAEHIAQAGVDGDLLFTMCQGPAALRALRKLRRTGIPQVHDADAIEACHRVRLFRLLAEAGVPRPAARLVRCADADREDLDWIASQEAVWVKRGDVHATEAADVCRVSGVAAAERALRGLALRGIAEAVLEAHLPGPTLKFYGVLGTGFFRAFEGDATEPARVAPDWPGLAEAGARALGLAVYGGDLVVDPAGTARLVDVNDWPSFSRCRQDAAAAISQYLLARLRSVREAEFNLAPPDEDSA